LNSNFYWHLNCDWGSHRAIETQPLLKFQLDIGTRKLELLKCIDVDFCKQKLKYLQKLINFLIKRPEKSYKAQNKTCFQQLHEIDIPEMHYIGCYLLRNSSFSQGTLCNLITKIQIFFN